jgi:hypothetical protein
MQQHRATLAEEKRNETSTKSDTWNNKTWQINDGLHIAIDQLINS